MNVAGQGQVNLTLYKADDTERPHRNAIQTESQTNP